jgi:hypothetical protein
LLILSTAEDIPFNALFVFNHKAIKANAATFLIIANAVIDLAFSVVHREWSATS